MPFFTKSTLKKSLSVVSNSLGLTNSLHAWDYCMLFLSGDLFFSKNKI